MRPYAQYAIDAALLERGRAIGRERWNLPADGHPEQFARLRRAAARERCTPREVLWRQAQDADVTSRPGGALFWGYRDPSDPSVESHYVALAWAERHNAADPDHPVTTFWTTQGAACLDPVNRLNEAQRAALDLDWDYLMRVWESMCLRFSEQCAGRTVLFGSHFHPHVILGRTELPALRRNALVGPDRIEFAYPPPERLSDGRRLGDELRSVLAEPGNQACIQFYDPACPGFLDPAEASRMPPRRLTEEVAALREQVETADRDWCTLPIGPDSPAGIPWYPPGPRLRSGAGSGSGL